MELIRLLVVDDHPVVRKGLRTMLALEPDMEVAAGADGYLLKGIPHEILVNAIRTVAAGGFVRGDGRWEGET
jgi:DNA-binding NarL/FixJ family response regulator